jgi:hypothetical protein
LAIGIPGMGSSFVVRLLGRVLMPWHRHLVHAR